MADITWQRPEFIRANEDWDFVDRIASGERAVKDAGDALLPRPCPTDKSPENAARYDQYLSRAVFYPVTGRTCKGLVSLVFRKDPIVEVPATLDYVKTDIDGAGNSIYQQSQKVQSKLLKRGRHALLADFPKTDGPVSQAEKQRLFLRATAVSVNANQIVNWRTSKVGGRHLLTLVVIRETVTDDDGFAVKEIEQYRQLELVDGVYSVTLWRKQKRKDGKEEWAVHDAYIPTNGSGQTWDIIPFQFIGADNNDSEIDQAPLDALARLNAAHYRNSADYEESAFFVGQAQIAISGLDEEWRDWLEKKGIYIGSIAPMLLPVGGSMDIKQAQPNTLSKEAMDTKEKQMVAIGAHLIENGSAVKTATQQNSEDAVSHSVVSLCAANISEAYTQCLKWMAEFENIPVTDDIEYKLNQEFTAYTADSQMVLAIVDSWAKGAFAKADMRDYLRKLNVIDPARTDEEIDVDLSDETDDLTEAQKAALMNVAKPPAGPASV